MTIKFLNENKFLNQARLKNMWVCRHPGLFFLVHPAGREKKIHHFQFEKIALILIRNISVTKNFFFRNEHQKNFLTCKFLVGPVEWRQTNIFLSLASISNFWMKLTLLNENDIFEWNYWNWWNKRKQNESLIVNRKHIIE